MLTKTTTDETKKKNPMDKIKCCIECPKEDYYGNMSRMKKHRLNCEIYNKCVECN